MYLKKGQKCDLGTLTELYGSSDIAKSILTSAEENKTVSRIESGHLTLPEPHDAEEYHHYKDCEAKGIDPVTAKTLHANPLIHGMFKEFSSRLAALEKKGGK